LELCAQAWASADPTRHSGTDGKRKPVRAPQSRLARRTCILHRNRNRKSNHPSRAGELRSTHAHFRLITSPWRRRQASASKACRSSAPSSTAPRPSHSTTRPTPSPRASPRTTPTPGPSSSRALTMWTSPTGCVECSSSCTSPSRTMSEVRPPLSFPLKTTNPSIPLSPSPPLPVPPDPTMS
jgi:hypothetical protein